MSRKASEQRVHTTMQRQVERDQQSWEKRLWHLGAQRFACQADARAALEQSLKQLPIWIEVQRSYLAHDHSENKGSPAKEAVPTQRWQCQAALSLNQERITGKHDVGPALWSGPTSLKQASYLMRN